MQPAARCMKTCPYNIEGVLAERRVPVVGDQVAVHPSLDRPARRQGGQRFDQPDQEVVVGSRMDATVAAVEPEARYQRPRSRPRRRPGRRQAEDRVVSTRCAPTGRCHGRSGQAHTQGCDRAG